MRADVIRYEFQASVNLDDVKASLLLATFAVESLHGEAEVRLSTAQYFDLERRTCVIDGTTRVGRDLSRLFVGFLSREFGPDSFTVSRVREHAAKT